MDLTRKRRVSFLSRHNTSSKPRHKISQQNEKKSRITQPSSRTTLGKPPVPPARTIELYYRTVEDIETRKSAPCRSVVRCVSMPQYTPNWYVLPDRRRRRCCVHARVSEMATTTTTTTTTTISVAQFTFDVTMRTCKKASLDSRTRGTMEKEQPDRFASFSLNCKRHDVFSLSSRTTTESRPAPAVYKS